MARVSSKKREVCTEGDSCVEEAEMELTRPQARDAGSPQKLEEAGRTLPRGFGGSEALPAA